MQTVRTVIAVAAVALVASFGAQAQKPDAAKAGQTTGEMSPQQKVEEGVVKAQKPAPSTVDRKELKKEAIAAKKSGQTVDGECGPEQKADVGACKKPATPKSTTARADVKKEAAAANKAGKTTNKD
jgi:hypothetical protein